MGFDGTSSVLTLCLKLPKYAVLVCPGSGRTLQPRHTLSRPRVTALVLYTVVAELVKERSINHNTYRLNIKVQTIDISLLQLLTATV